MEDKPVYSEYDLETGLINQLEKFLLELGKGFAFVERQKRISFDEILNECIRIVEDDDLNMQEELIYGMVKALKHVRDGKTFIFL